MLLLTFKIPEQQHYFTTKEVTAMTGMTKDALRYYEHLGILPDVQRNQYNYRQYSHKNLETLQLIKIFRDLDLDLSLLTPAHLALDGQAKVVAFKQYQQVIRDRIRHLEAIDQLLATKIDYFEHQSIDT
ncbi:MerR family transcriptional regulator [Lactiplantibacillus plantarum]|uniref:MerR family transcriptional regulator n=1 Tax=Lactiplantibacillus plantarum TaxID=1590 RepID=UPI0021CB6E59|nr:MerR family transcriptional regulator [Lactiplantibacillus plantarum]